MNLILIEILLIKPHPPKTNKEIRQPEKVQQRCQNFDEGFCPQWRTCTLIHAKDRKCDEGSTQNKRMQTRNGSTNQL